jgi:hypothetical protein
VLTYTESQAWIGIGTIGTYILARKKERKWKTKCTIFFQNGYRSCRSGVADMVFALALRLQIARLTLVWRSCLAVWLRFSGDFRQQTHLGSELNSPDASKYPLMSQPTRVVDIYCRCPSPSHPGLSAKVCLGFVIDMTLNKEKHKCTVRLVSFQHPNQLRTTCRCTFIPVENFAQFTGDMEKRRTLGEMNQPRDQIQKGTTYGLLNGSRF